jgi:arginine N-succinyltransferase
LFVYSYAINLTFCTDSDVIGAKRSTELGTKGWIMIILRPAQLSDLGQIERLAQASGPMVCTLPAQRSLLLKKIERSIASFAHDVWLPGEESYFFVLEEITTGQILGTAAINALAGFEEPFYALRNEIFIHSSRALRIHNRIHALSLTHDLSDHSQLCSFYVVPAIRDTVYPQLLTLGRLLYMSAHPSRFAEEWMAVLPGIADDKGHAPFWEHVGRKFFGMDYNQVEYYNGTKEKSFIAELMPHHPLYVPLLAEAAQEVMGQVHHDAELQCRLLAEQGFEADRYVEIFDAGPILCVKSNGVGTAQHRTPVPLSDRVCEVAAGMCLIATETPLGFCAVVAEANVTEGGWQLTQEVRDALAMSADAKVWCMPLRH